MYTFDWPTAMSKLALIAGLPLTVVLPEKPAVVKADINSSTALPSCSRC